MVSAQDGATKARPIELPGESALAGSALFLARDGLRFYEECERLGPLVSARVYHKRIYVLTGPSLIEQVLLKKARSFTKPALLRDLKALFGESLLTAEGELWKHRRRLAQPSFHKRRHADHGKIIAEGAEAMLSEWSPGPRDVHDDLTNTCIVNLTRAFFDTSDPALTTRIRDLATLCHGFVQALGNYRTPLYLFPSLLALRFRRKLQELEADIEALSQKCPVDSEARDAHAGFLARLTSAKDVGGCPMGKEAIRDEAVTMLLAGHETAAAAVSWALYLLAENPEARHRLCDELDEVCGDRLPIRDDLPLLQWLDKVLLETYRLYPPTHRIGRTVAEPVALDGIDLEVGCELIIPQWAIHRSTRWFVDPSRFHPERWTDDFIDRLPRFAFMPFSGGPRGCIGQDFVTLENLLLLGSIVKTFDFELAPESSVAPVEGLTLLPGDKGTMPLVLKKRTPHGPSRAPRRYDASDEAPSSLARALAPLRALDDDEAEP